VIEYILVTCMTAPLIVINNFSPSFDIDRNFSISIHWEKKPKWNQQILFRWAPLWRERHSINPMGLPRLLGQQKVILQLLLLGRFARLLTATTEERKRIAREVRLAARKEKKKIKSDAKKQRKQNAIMNRRMVRPSAPHIPIKYIFSQVLIISL
jgi:hypothetical protein